MDSKKPSLIKFELDDFQYETLPTRKFTARKPYTPDDPRQVNAFLPGIIAAIKVAAGQSVKRGDRIMTVEAMKMENAVFAPHDGVIKTVAVAAGEMVPKGRLLVEYEE